jgi:iron complex outermembrane receptor protein
VNSDYQDNRIDGRGFIIPAFRQFNLGGYIFYKHAFSTKGIIQMGERYDFGNIKTSEYYDWFPAPVIINNDTTLQYLKRADNVTRSISNISWSAGYNYNPGEWSFKINLGNSFRCPLPKSWLQRC